MLTLVQKYIIFLSILSSIMMSPARADIAATIEQKIKQTDPNLNIGIKITNLDQNKVIFEKNADRYFIPASTLKLITVASIIEHYGTDYSFTSNIFKSGKDYYLQIHDPDFKKSDLNALIVQLAKHSNKIADGNIYIVDSKFTLPSIMRTKTYSDTIYCYGAPINKVHINKNCTMLNVSSTRIGQKIKVTPNKDFPYIINNNAKTISQNNLDRLHTKIHNGKYIIDGTLSQQTNNVPIGAVTLDNLSQAKYYLQNSLAKYNIKLDVKILRKSLPTKLQKISSISKNIKDISAIAIKKSDNFITDYLLAEFATQKNQHEWRGGVSALKTLIMQKFSVDLSKTSLHDGSGISRLNLVTINHFDQFLAQLSKSKNFTTIKSIMAQPCEDSTLRERFKNIPNFYAKTGRLDNVSSLIGYFYDNNNELHSFVIIANNFYSTHENYHKLEETIIYSLLAVKN